MLAASPAPRPAPSAASVSVNGSSSGAPYTPATKLSADPNGPSPLATTRVLRSPSSPAAIAAASGSVITEFTTPTVIVLASTLLLWSAMVS